MNDTSLQGQHAVITGASRGIGAAIARHLAQAGARLTLLGRNQASLEALVEQLPVPESHSYAAVDVANHHGIQQAINTSIQVLGPIHILVNNAGQAESRSMDQTSPELWQRMLDVNLTGTYNSIHAALPSLRLCARPENPSRIINVASTAGLQGYPQVSAYCAAKHGVVGLTRALALELARHHITANAVCPGYTETDIAIQAIESVRKNTGKTAEESRALLTKRNPQQRFIQPDEVAAAIIWLCQPESASINGQMIAIDGGELAG